MTCIVCGRGNTVRAVTIEKPSRDVIVLDLCANHALRFTGHERD